MQRTLKTLFAFTLLITSGAALAQKSAGETVDDTWLHTKVKGALVGYGQKEEGRQLATLDRISGGRAVLGVGVGYRPYEFAGFGAPYDRRGTWHRRWCDSWFDRDNADRAHLAVHLLHAKCRRDHTPGWHVCRGDIRWPDYRNAAAHAWNAGVDHDDV